MFGRGRGGNPYPHCRCRPWLPRGGGPGRQPSREERQAELEAIRAYLDRLERELRKGADAEPVDADR